YSGRTGREARGPAQYHQPVGNGLIADSDYYRACYEVFGSGASQKEGQTVNLFLPVIGLQMESIITCPKCQHAERELIPANQCMFFYECKSCHAVLRPKAGECLRVLFLRFGKVPNSRKVKYLFLCRSSHDCQP